MELSLGFATDENMSIMDSTNAFTIPYLAEAKNDFSFGTELIDNNNSSLTLGYLQSDNNSIDKQAIAASYTHKNYNTSFITGLTQEKKGFIGTSVSGAFSLDNSTTPTTFIGLNHSKKLGEKSNYGILIAAGLTNVVNNKDTNLFENISDIYTSNAGFYIKSKDYITINDEIKFSISQPQRVENGSALLLIPKRNDISGNLNFDKTLIDLEPSGRQMDLSLKYTNKLQHNMIINFENIISNNYNHSSLNKLNNTFVTSFIYKF